MAWKSVPGRDHHLFTIDEYLALERTAEERHEYLDGCVYAMAGESLDHGRICVNLTRRLAEQLAGSPCEVFSKDSRSAVGRHHERARGCRACSRIPISAWSAVPCS